MLPFFAAAAWLAAVPARAQADREVVRVNGTPIRQSEVFERLWARFGNETLDEMVDDLLLRQAAAQRKITAEPSEIERRLTHIKEGFPDPKLFTRQLEAAGITIEKVKADIADHIKRERLVASERKLSVTDAELRKAFDENKANLGVKEAIHLRHILVKTQAEAAEILTKVKAGGDFTVLARERSLAPTGKINGGDYGFVTRGMLPSEIEEIAFAMKVDEMKIVPSQHGFHVLQAAGRRAATPATFDQVKTDLRTALLQEKIKAALPELIQELRQKAEIKPSGRG